MDDASCAFSQLILTTMKGFQIRKPRLKKAKKLAQSYPASKCEGKDAGPWGVRVGAGLRPWPPSSLWPGRGPKPGAGSPEGSLHMATPTQRPPTRGAVRQDWFSRPGSLFLTWPKGSRWLFVSFSFWKETSCRIQWAPVAGESGWT